MAHSQEQEAASRSSETYLAENGGGRPASVQPRSCIRVEEGTGQNYLARTHGNGYVTDKPRMMMMMMMLPLLLLLLFHMDRVAVWSCRSPDALPFIDIMFVCSCILLCSSSPP